MPEGTEAVEEKQCRICLDGPEAESELGRLIRPCLCRGSISYVHVRCLQRWRTSSASKSAFFSCPQCHYHYHFVRTSAFGIATNPVVVGTVSAMLFTSLVMVSSYLTTFFVSSLDEPSYWYSFYVSPIEVVGDLVRASVRIFQDEAGFEDTIFSRFSFTDPNNRRPRQPSIKKPPGLLKRFFHRFLLGLPVVGAGSIVHMLFSLPFIGPVHWLARYRGSRNRRGSSRDMAAILIVLLIVVGALRALVKVYQLTEKVTKRILLRAEDAILEVG